MASAAGQRLYQPSMNWTEMAMRAAALVLELPPVEQLAFEGGKEALAHRIVVRVAGGAIPMDGRTPASLHLQAEGDGGVLSSDPWSE